MSGNIQKIPSDAVSATPLGETLKRFHTGETGIVDYIYKWKNRGLIPRLRSLDGQWNKTVVNLLGGLSSLYSIYNIDITRPFDSKKVFIDPENTTFWENTFDRPMLLEEGIFALFLKGGNLKDSYSILSTQASKIKNFSPPANFTELIDVPSTYTGQAGKYLGIDHNGTSVSFLYPKTQASLLSVSDGLGTYPLFSSLLTSGPTTLSTKDFFDSRNWRMESLVFTGLIDLFNLSGTACDNVLYSVDLGAMASNTAFHITLGATFDGARVSFKTLTGENLNNNKYIHADTGAGITLMNATPPDNYQIVPPFALTFVYSTAAQSYYLTEKFEAF